MNTVDTIRIPDRQYQERFPIPHCRQHSIRLFVLPPCAAVQIEAAWTGQTASTRKNSMTPSLATSISYPAKQFNRYHDPAHPVAKRITKAIGSPSICASRADFMDIGVSRRPISGARIHSESCTFSIGE